MQQSTTSSHSNRAFFALEPLQHELVSPPQLGSWLLSRQDTVGSPGWDTLDIGDPQILFLGQHPNSQGSTSPIKEDFDQQAFWKKHPAPPVEPLVFHTPERDSFSAQMASGSFDKRGSPTARPLVPDDKSYYGDSLAESAGASTSEASPVPATPIIHNPQSLWSQGRPTMDDLIAPHSPEQYGRNFLPYASSPFRDD
ncbi:hypothetical protein OC846_001815 [Tilletia horrida]|uniref:Uncharacterized protein n=1 Tax=Tilletia horrida TaxID=155126 RepID=A0AAN6GY57_9BASI|nr:hypothetical protein OC846_001815 [Tilletia horrida]KAK0568404.1 hypothetical protein OC861_001961 [Tilletia horrida]